MIKQKPLIDGPISTAFITNQLDKNKKMHSTGAQAFFVGQVRADRKNKRSVIGIEYSAYEQLVEKAAQKISNQLLQQYNDLLSVGIYHSTGLVKTGEISLLVIVSSGHRKHAFSALEDCVEEIKASLPVWKKELYDDKSSTWLEK